MLTAARLTSRLIAFPRLSAPGLRAGVRTYINFSPAARPGLLERPGVHGVFLSLALVVGIAASSILHLDASHLGGEDIRGQPSSFKIHKLLLLTTLGQRTLPRPLSFRRNSRFHRGHSSRHVSYSASGYEKYHFWVLKSTLLHSTRTLTNLAYVYGCFATSQCFGYPYLQIPVSASFEEQINYLIDHTTCILRIGQCCFIDLVNITAYNLGSSNKVDLIYALTRRVYAIASGARVKV
jgi:hypothetical protein